MGRIAKLWAEIGADTTKLKSALTTAKGDLGKFKTTTGGATGSLLGFNIAALAGGAALTTVVMAAKKAISAASDLSETQNKVAVVFKKSSAEIMEFGDNAADSLGMSKNAALSAAGMFGNLFVSMGMTNDKSAEMSKGLVTLAADLSSFNNIDSATALEKLRAGLVGETEPLRALGVNLSAATVEARAMAMGFSKVDGAFSASVKAMAAYELIMEQTKTAQGDFAKTSDGLANAQRRLQATFEDLTAEAGTKLLPIAEKLTNELLLRLTIVEKLDAISKDHVETMKKTTMSYADYRKEQIRVNKAVFEALPVLTQLGSAFIFNRQELYKYTGAQRIMTQAEWDNRDAVAASDERLMQWGTTVRTVSDELPKAAQAIAGVNTQMDVMRNFADQTAQAYRDMNQSQDDLKAATESFGEQIGGDLKSQFEAAGIKGGELDELLGIIDETMGTAYQPAQQLEDMTAKLVKDYMDGGRDGEAFKKTLEDMKGPMEDLYGPLRDARTEAELFLAALKNLTERQWEIAVKMGAPIAGGGPTLPGGGGVSAPTGSIGGGHGANPDDDNFAVGGPMTDSAWVGEQGPELQVGGRGTYVLSNKDAMAAVKGDGIVINMYLTGYGQTPNAQILGGQVAREIQRRM